MAQEIERKFLVTSNEYRSESQAVYYHQGYLSSEPSRTVRVRVAGEKAYITIKGKNKGAVRAEFEYEIPVADALQLLEMCQKPTIEKYRYTLQKDITWVVDEFLGENEGLVVAEAELSDENQSFDRPEWVGEEVTNDNRYYNVNLAQHPYKLWK